MPGWRILLWAVLVLTAVLFLYLVRGILLPFILSFVIASLLEPTVRKLRLKGWKRGTATACVVLPFYLLLTLLTIAIAPKVAQEVSGLTDRFANFTDYLSKANENDNFFLRWNPATKANESDTTAAVDRAFAQYGSTLGRVGLPTSRRAAMEQYIEPRRPEIAKAVRGFFEGFFGFLTNLFSRALEMTIILILVPLILSEMEDLKRRGPRWIPPSIRASTMGVLSDIGQVFVKYLRGISTVVLLFTIAQTVMLMVLGVPYALLLGPIFGALYLIPYIGNIGSAVTVFLLVGLSNVTGGVFHPFASPWAYAIFCTVCYLIVGFAFDHLIYPQMVGNSVGLSPVVSMFVIFCGAALFGLVGMLIAFPLAGSVKVILDRLIRVTSSSQDSLQLPAVPLRHRTSAT